jgi:uncharacterized protein
MLEPNEKKALQELKNKIRLYNIIDIKLYGSKARGDSTADSDIDVMIEIEDNDYKTKSAISNIIYEIDLEYDTFISPVYFSRMEIEEGPMSESPLYKAIQREGISL